MTDLSRLSRRDLLKVLAATGGATALSTLPSQWDTPVIRVGALPAFAQTSPGQYSFSNEVESVSFEGPDSDKLKYAVTPGWIVVAEENQTVGGQALDTANNGTLPLWIIGQPWLKIKRKWEVVGPPWAWVIKIKIKIKFFALPGFLSTDIPADDVENWFFGISGANLDDFLYYVTKVKIKKNKVEFEFLLPAFGSGLFPFFISGYFPFQILLLSGGSLFPGYYLGPCIVGDNVGSTFFK